MYFSTKFKAFKCENFTESRKDALRKILKFSNWRKQIKEKKHSIDP